MTLPDDVHVEVEDRISEFMETFGNEGFFEDGMIESLEKMHQLSEIFFGTETATIGFNTMIGHALPGGVISKHGWREHLDDNFGLIFSETRLGQLLHDLTAYCDFGVVLTQSRDDEQRRQVLAGQIRTAEQLLAILPAETWQLDDERLLKVIHKSLARWKLDNGQPLSAEELSVLSGRALQTIKNKLAGQSKEINGTQLKIEAAEAAAWLSVQKDYYPSIWKEQDDTRAIVEIDKGMGDVAFVPVAKDGSIFHPGLKRDGKYLVDSDGAEREFESFDEALAALQRMHFPEWRRPTPEGRWTRVRGVDWRRVPLDELNRQARADQT